MEHRLKVALKKLENYCAYQERCHQEVVAKSKTLGINFDETNQLLSELIKSNYLNEERFALLYARSKANQKKWGPIKIEQGLKQKEISTYLINKAIQELTNLDSNLEKLIKQYLDKKQLKLSQYKDKQLLIKYLLSKGYQYADIFKHIEK